MIDVGPRTSLLLHLERVLLGELAVILRLADFAEGAAGVAAHLAQIKLFRKVYNLIDIFFQAEHFAFILAPAEDFSLSCHSEALFVSGKNLCDFM